MPKYILQFRSGGKEFKSQSIEAETHKHASILFKKRHSRKLKGMSDFDIMDNIGVIKYSKELDKAVGYDNVK